MKSLFEVDGETFRHYLNYKDLIEDFSEWMGESEKCDCGWCEGEREAMKHEK